MSDEKKPVEKKEKPKPAGWKYKGPGFLPGYPAKDISAEEVERRGLDVNVLRTCGLYIEEK